MELDTIDATGFFLLAAAVVKGLPADDPERGEWERWARERPLVTRGPKGLSLGSFVLEPGSPAVEDERRKRTRRKHRGF